MAVNPYFNEAYSKIVERLLLLGHEVQVATNRKDIAKYFKNKYIPVTDIDDFTKTNQTTTRGFLVRNRYGMGDVDEMTMREIKIYKRDKRYVRGQITKYLGFLKHYKDVDVIANFDHGLLNIVVDKFAKKQGILAIHKHGMAISQGKLIWDKGIDFTSWVRRSDNPLTEKEEKEVETYIEGVKSKKSLVGVVPVRPDMNRFKKFFGYTWKYISAGKSRKDFLSPWTIMWRWGLIPLRRYNNLKYYSIMLGPKKYVYFPMQVWDDIAIVCDNNKFFEQHKLIKKIAETLPRDIQLVVKEHPAMLGTMPPHWLKEISKIGNVTIVNPFTNSHNIIRHSEFVITISSTVGWEATIWGKPVIALGNTFYSWLVPKTNIRDLKNVIKKVRRVHKNKVKKFTRDMLASEYDCYFFEPDLKINTKDDNINKITDSLLDVIQRYG